MTAELIDIDDYRPIWQISKQRCRDCGHSQSPCLIRRDAHPDHMECSACGGMTASVTHYLVEDMETGEERWEPRLEEVRS